MSGTKNDKDKPDFSLLPYAALEALARVLDFGAAKYDRNNYRKGFDNTRLLAAALRHIHAYSNGEDLDPESGLSHLDHGLASIAMLLQNQKDGVSNDTRGFEELKDPIDHCKFKPECDGVTGEAIEEIQSSPVIRFVPRNNLGHNLSNEEVDAFNAQIAKEYDDDHDEPDETVHGTSAYDIVLNLEEDDTPEICESKGNASWEKKSYYFKPKEVEEEDDDNA